MTYFVTGATGFIGRRLVERLLERKGKIHVLVREDSLGRLDELIEHWETVCEATVSRRIHPGRRRFAHALVGTRAGADLRTRRDRRALLPPGCRVRHDRAGGAGHGGQRRWHQPCLGAGRARLGPSASITSLRSRSRAPTKACSARTSSTRASACLRPITPPSSRPSARCANRRSSRGAFTGRGSSSGTPRRARWTRSTVPTTSSRRSKGCAKSCPSGCRLVGLDLGKTNIVPVDWVAGALDHIAHRPNLDGQAFQLTYPGPQKVDEVINDLAAAAHAPRFAVSVDKRVLDAIPTAPLSLLMKLPPLRQARRLTLRELGIPRRGARAPRPGAHLRHAPGRAGIGRLGVGASAGIARVCRAAVGLLGARDGPEHQPRAYAWARRSRASAS